MQISMIAAIAENNVLGKDNQLIWHLPADLRYFKQVTMGKPIIMGRKTYESIGRPLPGRKNIVLTQNKQFHAEGIEIAYDIEQALALAADADEVMIIGGATIYTAALPKATKIYLTKVHHTFEGDAFFPQLEENSWEIIQQEYHQKDEKNPYDYEFLVLERNI